MAAARARHSHPEQPSGIVEAAGDLIEHDHGFPDAAQVSVDDGPGVENVGDAVGVL